MRPVSQKMTDGWKREDKTGEYRPCVRATIQMAALQRFPYSTQNADGGDWEHQRQRKGDMTSIVFGDAHTPVELRGIKTCEWQRSLDQDVASCTITMMNSEQQPIGQADPGPEDFDRPGEYTYDRGVYFDEQGYRLHPDGHVDRWGRAVPSRWRAMIMPDRLVKTFEGYGSDYTVPPAKDPNLAISGVWLIDKVTYTADGEISLEMRDLGRMLLTHICFPPAVPFAEYPLSFEKIRTAQVPGRDAKGGKWKYLKGLATATSSNTAYVNKGLTDPPYPYYVSKNGHVNGHHPNDAIKAEPAPIFVEEGAPAPKRDDKYWMSTGQTSRNSFVWWEATFNKALDGVAGLNIAPRGGPYRIYVSIKTKDGWLGRKKIPYAVTTEDIDNDAKIPFVESVWADRWNDFDLILKRKYRNVKKIRLTFTKLNDNQVGDYPWRAMLREVKVYTGKYADLHFGRGEKAKVVGNYRDFTQIVKWICGWGGFWWPQSSLGRDFWMVSPDERQYVSYPNHDSKTFVNGRVWGTFQNTGTAGQAALTVDLFDKKPFMDVINYVRDIVGFIFHIDEWGGVVWRLPNLYQPGNYLAPDPTDLESRARRSRTSDYITLDETETLLDYSTELDSENIRERIFISNATGKIGTVVRGFNPTYEGFRRTAGWSDQNFASKRETVVMADMIAAQQMFNYRRTTVTTPGYPALQLDDQIRIYERVTNETYFHYVLGISSNLNMQTGEWTYDLNTHWLGSNREDAWVIKTNKLAGETRDYLAIIQGNQDMGD